MQHLGAFRTSKLEIRLSQSPNISLPCQSLGTLMKSMTPCLRAQICHNRDLNLKPSCYKGVVCIQFIEVIGYCHTIHDFFHTTPQAPFWYTMLKMSWCDLGHMKGQWPQVRVRTYLQATWDLSTQYKPLMFLLYAVMN